MSFLFMKFVAAYSTLHFIFLLWVWEIHEVFFVSRFLVDLEAGVFAWKIWYPQREVSHHFLTQGWTVCKVLPLLNYSESIAHWSTWMLSWRCHSHNIAKWWQKEILVSIMTIHFRGGVYCIYDCLNTLFQLCTKSWLNFLFLAWWCVTFFAFW